MDAWATAAFVLRHGCGGVDVPGATRLIGDFAFEQPTWDEAFSANRTEWQVLHDVRRLCGHGILDSWVNCFCVDCTEYGDCGHGYSYMDAAAERGYFSVVRFLHEHGKRGFTSRGVVSAAANGHVKVLKFLVEKQCESDDGRMNDAMKRAVEKGHLDIVRYLHEREVSTTPEAAKLAALGGHLDVIEILWTDDSTMVEPKYEWTSEVPRAAAESGHSHVVRWLYEHTLLPCDVESIIAAARHGDTQLIQFLLHSIDASYPPQHLIQDLMDQAADGNHLELMRYLETLGGSMMTKRAMDGATAHGNMTFLKHLHEHSSEGCSTKAMDGAAENGHLDVIEFLHGHRTEGCTRRAMEMAAANGHLAVIQFLHDKMAMKATSQAIHLAVINDHLEVVEYLHSQDMITLDTNLAKLCIAYGHLRVLKYLCDNGLTTLRPNDLLRPSQENEDETRAFMVEYLTESPERVYNNEFHLKVVGIVTMMAKRGKLKQIQFLSSRYDVSRFNCSDAINAAAVDGRLDVLQYFHARGYQGFSATTMVHALADGNLPCVKFLREDCDIQCPPNAIDTAVAQGGLDLVQYLHDQCAATATTDAMDTAAGRGKLDVVQFLNEQRSEGCSSKAMESAADNGHLAAVQYLHLHCPAACTQGAMDLAAENLAVVEATRHGLT